MKYHVLIYNGYVSFEIMLATYFLKTKGNIVTVGLSRDPVKSCDDFTVLPDLDIHELDVNDVNLLLIPGGELERIQDHSRLQHIVQQLMINGKVVAGICSAAVWVRTMQQQSGTFVPFIQRNGVEIAGNVITAPPQRYADFAIELGKVMDIYQDEADLEETVRFFKEYTDE